MKKTSRSKGAGRRPRRVIPRERAAVEPHDPRELRRVFGRPDAPGEHWVPTDLGCPDCRGVLYVAALGGSGWLSFRCRVGHAFASDSLIAAKENQLEQALWGSLEVLEEIVQLYEALEARQPQSSAGPASSEYRCRSATARRHQRELRGLIEGEGPVPLGKDDSNDEGASS
jgi:hypothetical protein